MLQSQSNLAGTLSCPACGYALKGLPRKYNCPECGFAADGGARIVTLSNRRRILREIAYAVVLLYIILRTGQYTGSDASGIVPRLVEI